jgi:hypothetical protein
MRIRDIVHVSGRRLRIALDQSAGESMLLQLSEPESPSAPVLLDLYGGELLSGFLMNARLAGRSQLGEERCGGVYACRLRLAGGSIELSQHRSRLVVPDVLWDRLYAELMLALAHGRHRSGEPARVADGTESRPRLLH